MAASRDVVERVLRWYVRTTLSASADRMSLPFYCNRELVGLFAVAPAELRRGDEAALFRMFVGLAMFQARRDVVVMAQQRTLPARTARQLTSLSSVQRAVRRHPCPWLMGAEAFDHCDVRKERGVVDCGTLPGAACHVKEATVAFNRMGDMGKLPSSAWFRIWAEGGVRRLVREVIAATNDPAVRARNLVTRFARVHRVGEKLATLFVSALSTPALAPGLTPWYPEIDGNALVVVDTHVARAADTLRPRGAPKTYSARAKWVRDMARKIDLRAFHEGFPKHSPRIVQEALYALGSRSNREQGGYRCEGGRASCTCVPVLCPFCPDEEERAR